MGLGIFGGSFDPVHNGHLFVAEAVREACDLSRVLFVPTRAGHHRAAPLTPGDVRADMIRMAIAANPAFAFDDSDLADDATGFTADLLPRLSTRYPGEELTFIVGGDSLVRSRWERLEAILDRLTAFVIAPRGDEDSLSRPAAGGRIGDADPGTFGRTPKRALPRSGTSLPLHQRK
jgi:nicotinate-nucleotide adenylyltransferase